MKESTVQPYFQEKWSVRHQLEYEFDTLLNKRFGKNHILNTEHRKYTEQKSAIKRTFLSLRLQSLPLVNKEKERDMRSLCAGLWDGAQHQYTACHIHIKQQKQSFVAELKLTQVFFSNLWHHILYKKIRLWLVSEKQAGTSKLFIILLNFEKCSLFYC